MNRFLLTSLLLLLSIAAFACPACEKQQPELLRGVSHGAGPQSNWDYVIVWAAVLIVLATLFYTIKWLVKPGEKSEEHIKRTVLEF
ncbi:hypothetical protein [Telluribacter humicola]|uniref:hypothetical protein n=1 Tax=Telluribacter humicola TaxID=1720261 RepID=UPI001A9792A5|nr:hypothetical protein [Telluribacter humicola]